MSCKIFFIRIYNKIHYFFTKNKYKLNKDDVYYPYESIIQDYKPLNLRLDEEKYKFI